MNARCDVCYCIQFDYDADVFTSLAHFFLYFLICDFGAQDMDVLASASATLERIPSDTGSDDSGKYHTTDEHGNVIYQKVPDPNFPPLFPEHFSADDATGIAEHMEEHGFVVVKDVVDSDYLKKLFIEDMEEVNPDLHKKTKDRDVEDVLWSMEESIDYPRPGMPGLGGMWDLHANCCCSRSC